MSELTLEKIMEMDAFKNHAERDRESVRRAWYNVRKNSQVYIANHGDSIIVVDTVGAHKGEFHFINAARFQDFIRNVQQCLKDVKNATGMEEIYTYFTNERILDVAFETGYPHSVEKLPGEGEGYKMTVRL